MRNDENSQNLLRKLAKIESRYLSIEQKMMEPELLADYQKVAALAKERSDMSPIVEGYRQYQLLLEELAGATEILESESDPEFLAMATEEVKQLEAQCDILEESIKGMLVPTDPRDEKNVFIEIRAGAGGDEAGIFAADLLRMYTRYAELRRWKTDIVGSNSTGVGGYKEAILSVKGKGAYSKLKFESGVHRVQRVPTTESQGRIHTSTATVAVIPEVEDVEITVDMREVEITSTFASGPGGQHMQKNATAVRIVHLPTGITIRVQSERSLTQNKRTALGILQVRLQEQGDAKQAAETAAERKSQVGTGDRSEKIRTYNYPQGRVTDHRIGLTSYNLPAVIEGDIDVFIEALSVADQAARLAAEDDDDTGGRR